MFPWCFFFAVSVSAAFLGTTRFTVPPDCGRDSNTCFTLHRNSVVLMQRKHRTWWAQRFYAVRYSVDSLSYFRYGNATSTNFDLADCKFDSALVEYANFTEHSTTCETAQREVKLSLSARMYRRADVVRFGAERMPVSAGEVKVLFALILEDGSLAAIDPYRSMHLRTSLEYDFPSNWWQLLMSGFNDNSASARDNLVSISEGPQSGTGPVVDIDAIFRLRMRHIAGVRLCLDTFDCDEDLAAAKLAANANDMAEIDFFGKLRIPKRIDFDWTWQGSNNRMEGDPTFVMGSGKLTQGSIHAWALFICVAVLALVILLVAVPSMVCLCCVFCPGCSCIKDVVCRRKK
eukprot:Filipodium_phascolosomae@DN256_c0_g1_i1.p1